MSDSLFRLHKLTLPGSDVPRLNSVTLQIPCGVTAIVGLSGAGKTSLLNVLAGFETGFSGELTSGVATGAAHRLPLFWVPQSGGLWPHLSAEQHLDVVTGDAARNQKSGNETELFSKRSDEILSLFDLTHRRQALPGELSQGERSRLGIARALATRATVLLLDEPLSHVDPVRKPVYWNIIRRNVAEENISMVFVSHEPETVLRHAEHVICLHDGAVVFDGPVRTLYDHPPDAQVGEFLGPLNWFRAEEAAVFLNGDATASDVVVRPERLKIRTAKDSAIQLLSTPFVGAYQESTVRHVESGMTKSVLHQVPDVILPIGQRVAFRVHLRPGGAT